MASLVTTFLVSLAACALFTPGVRWLALSWGVLDTPDGFRKCHPNAMPLWGGVAVYPAVVLALYVARLGAFARGYELEEIASVLVAMAGFVCFIGVIDDDTKLRPRVKLLLQIGAVLPLVLAGFRVHSVALFGDTFDLGWTSVPLTVLWLLICINAINLLDGMDGLASVVGLAASLTLGIIAAYTGNRHVTVAAVALAGALAGFLIYNRPPARIFLGDSGSMVIGVILGILGIQSTLKTSTTLSITAPLVVMTFPMFDTFLAVVRRRLTGRPFDAADRQHIHHRLLDRGMGPWFVLGTIGALCLATGAAAFAATAARSDLLAWATALTLVVLVVRLRWFGYYEWRLVWAAAERAWAMLRRGRIFFAPHPSGRVRRQLARLSARQVWAALIERAEAWNVTQMRLALIQEGRLRWRRVWQAPYRPTDERGWAVAVSVSCHDGWTCEVRAGGESHADAEFISPAGLLRLLNAFAAHFADHREQVEELTDGDTTEFEWAWNEEEDQCRAA